VINIIKYATELSIGISTISQYITRDRLKNTRKQKVYVGLFVLGYDFRIHSVIQIVPVVITKIPSLESNFCELPCLTDA